MSEKYKIGDRLVNMDIGGKTYFTITDIYVGNNGVVYYNGMHDTHFRIPTKKEIGKYFK